MYQYGQLRYRYGRLRYRYGQERYRYGQTVHLARRGFQDCVVYCLLPPTLVYFVVLQPRLFSVYCLIHCTTTRTPFSELPQALCWPAIIFSVTRAVISLLPNIILCHSLLASDILFPGAATMTKLAFLFRALSSAPSDVGKRIWPERKVIMCATFVVYIRSVESLDTDLV